MCVGLPWSWQRGGALGTEDRKDKRERESGRGREIEGGRGKRKHVQIHQGAYRRKIEEERQMDRDRKDSVGLEECIAEAMR